MKWGVFGTLLFWVAFVVDGRQLSFKLDEKTEEISYSYRWIDLSSQSRHIQFQLDKDALDATPHMQKNYRPTLAQRYVAVALTKAAQEMDPRTANIDIQQRGETIEIKVRSRSEEQAKAVQNELQNIREEAFNRYLREHYYIRYVTPKNVNAIKPDHVRYIHESTAALIPLSQAFYDKITEHSDARAYFNLLLSWVQSIPYDTLEDRKASNGSGFSPPASLLSQNKGDCDSKSVLTAAIIRAFLPQTPMVLVMLPEHALLGIALPPQGSDTTVVYNDTTYVLMEPTGPALLPLGEVADTTADLLGSGLFTVEKIQ